MIIRVNGDRLGLAVLAKVEVRARCMHALEPSSCYTFLTNIARCEMNDFSPKTFTHHQILGRPDSNEPMTRVLVGSDDEARSTSVKVRTIKAFKAVSTNTRVAEVACRVVVDGFVCSRGD